MCIQISHIVFFCVESPNWVAEGVESCHISISYLLQSDVKVYFNEAVSTNALFLILSQDLRASELLVQGLFT